MSKNRMARIITSIVRYYKIEEVPAFNRDLARYPDNPKAGFRISGDAGYQISGRIFG
jgi:hypothetical protein